MLSAFSGIIADNITQEGLIEQTHLPVSYTNGLRLCRGFLAQSHPGCVFCTLFSFTRVYVVNVPCVMFVYNC